ncbi:cell differentiation protein rcd1 [Ceratobasidium sp. AG-Ba]|nr:cell differentiation protein rcd1 [Ceratobasidium sp. AG-Ba]
MYTPARDYAPRLNAANVGVNPNMNMDSLRFSTPPPNLGGTTPAPPYGQGAPHHLLGNNVGGLGVGVGGMNNVGGGNMGGGALGQYSAMGQQQQQQQQALMNMGAQQLALQMQQTMGNVGVGVGNMGVGVGMGGPNANVGMGMGGSQGQMNQMGHEEAKIYQLVMDLMDPSRREGALLELSKKREQFDDLALVLWHSFGVMAALLQEIVSVYPLLSPPALTAHASNRVCNALALMQCVASHQETRQLFLNAHIPLFLYPFLNTTSKTRPFEYLRLTSLGVVGALVKQNDNAGVIHFLLSTEIIPLCLRIMETGSELSKTVAIFIVQKILLDDTGLNYICHTYERFYAVGTVLSNMVAQLVENQVVRLLKHVVRCYLRLSDNMRAREALRACLPEPLRDNTFANLLKGDTVTKRCLASLLNCLSDRPDQRTE